KGGSGFPAIQSLGIGATNAGKKVMIRGWLQREKETFIVVNKPEYDLILGSNWLIGNNINILSPSLYTFYELLFSNFTAINSDGEVIITKFFKHYTVMDNLDLSEYYDSDYTETESSGFET
ncbi:27268_t:CDS:2, partial [Racocetra persica]